MQGLPRINMISLDLKESNETPDLSPLYNYIESHYHESSENYKDTFKEFINLRQLSISGSENLNCLTNMKRYYSQLQLLKARFPLSSTDNCAITWYWEDSNSNTTVSLTDIRFEEASVLYNIGSLHCNLGAKELRVDLDSTKVACTHFQCSAWAFQTILEKYTPLSVADLECDLLRFLNLLMLAQAHECVLEKSMVDQRRAGITAKIAFQISDFYKQCQGLLKSDNIGYAVNSRHYKIWKRTCVLKEHLYFCLSYYYMGLVAEEANKYGDIVAWMKLAKEKLEKCTKPVKELKNNVAEETIKFVQDVVTGKLESSIKDNNFVYYEKVPESDMLPPIKGAMLLKGIAFDVHDPDICGKDIFHNLIPMETHFSSSVYSEKKAEILRNIQSDVEEKNDEMQQFLNNMQWDTDSLSLTDMKPPQELFSCAAFVAANPDILTTIKNTMQDISSISIEVEESLEILSDKMRHVKIDKSVDSWKLLDQEYSEFISNFEDAKESNNQLRDAFACTFDDFTLVKQSMEQFIESLPSLNELAENEDTKALIGESKRLLDKVEEMTKQRSDLLQQLKTEMLNDDLTQQLLSSKHESEKNKIIEDGLKKHNELIDYLRQNMSAQTKIMDAIVEHNAKIADVKLKIYGIKQERTKIIARIVRSFNFYKNILKKGEEGIDFYRKLSDRISKLQKDVDKLNPQKIVVAKPEMKPIPESNERIDTQSETKNVYQQLKSESESTSFTSYSLPPQSVPSQPLRLKDYLKDRKKTPSLRASHQKPIQLNTSQEAVAQPDGSMYQYTPWGFYGPPSGQATYTANYSVSKCKVKDNEFRTTQNVYLPTPASEIGSDHSVYSNYSSLPRTNYSSFSTPFNTSMCSASSIGNLSSNTGFTIPYQHNSFDNPNIISMAHCFNHPSVPVSQAKTSSNDFERHQYCSYPYTNEMKDSQYFSHYQNAYTNSGFVNNMQHVQPYFIPPHSQSDSQYPEIPDNQTQSIGDTKLVSQDSINSNYPLHTQMFPPNQNSKHLNLQSNVSQNQYFDQKNMTPQPNISQNQYYDSTNMIPQSNISQLQYSDSRNMNFQPNISQNQYFDPKSMTSQPNSSQNQYYDYKNMNPQSNVSQLQYSDPRNVNLYTNSSHNQYSDTRNINFQTNASQNQYFDPKNMSRQPNVSQNQYSDPRNVNLQPNVSQNQYSDLKNLTPQPTNSQNQYSDSRNANLPPNVSQNQYPGPKNITSQSNVSQMQYSDPRNVNLQSNVSQNQYPGPKNIASQSNVSQMQYSDPRNVNLQLNVSQNQYFDSRNLNFQANISQNQYPDTKNLPVASTTQFTDYSNNSLSNYQQNQCPASSVSNNYSNVTGLCESQSNYQHSQHFEISSPKIDKQKTDSPKHTDLTTQKQIIDSHTYPKSLTNKTTTYDNSNNTVSQSKLDKTRDLLSSSPTNAFKKDTSIAVLEPKILTKQEIEDQKEEKRKQIYHKQHSGSKHPLNDHLVLNRFIADAERFLKKLNELLDPNNSTIFEQHWNQLNEKERALPKKSTAIAKCSPMKNRMQEFVPYDENRVIIKDGKDDYINASHILLQNIDECFPRFITCQSPLSNTVSEFWTAIFEQGCEILVQLASPCSNDDTSKGRVVSYWPDPKSKSLSVGSKFEISVQSFKEKPNWYERILLIKHLKTNQSRSVWHFQANNISNKLPKSLDEFLSFETELCRYYRQQRSLTRPIGVSCINGSSFCGVFVLLTSVLLQMEITGIFPDIDNILLAMWSQRKNLLDDKHQLTFVYKAISKASSDILSKRNIVIGPGRLSTSAHSSTAEHSSHSTVITQSSQIAPTISSANLIMDSIFTNQHLQLSDLDSVVSKLTIKPDDNVQEQNKITLANKRAASIPDILTTEKDIVAFQNDSEMESSAALIKTSKDIQLPLSLLHLQDPSSIDFTPTPADKRKMTKREFEAKLNNTYIEPASNVDCFDPLKALDPFHQLQ